jgi:ribonuclease HI
VLKWITGHCNRAAVSRNRYGVEKTVDIHKILINDYIDTISDIKENIGTLMRYGMRTTLSQIPDHANIAGNEIADQLAKEAAK